MGFRYLNRIATPEHLTEFLELADLAAGGGADAGNVFELSRRLQHSTPMRLCIKRLLHDADAAALIASRKVAGPYDQASLLRLPKGSLGHTYATVMQTMGYDINFFPEPAFYNNLASDADYINHRVYATHDIHHILSGFSLDNYGEAGVISISVAQFTFPAFTFLNLIGMLLNWFANDRIDEEINSEQERLGTLGYAYDLASQGLAMGIRAKPLFPVLWEERMAQNLDELRHELGIEPVREGPYSWYSNAAIQAALG